MSKDDQKGLHRKKKKVLFGNMLPHIPAKVAIFSLTKLCFDS